jgi:hypothetical protein
MRADDLRRWIRDRQAGEERERKEARSTPNSPEEAIASALALVALFGRLHGWPIPDDPVSVREDALARTRWSKLRLALRERGRIL